MLTQHELAYVTLENNCKSTAMLVNAMLVSDHPVHDVPGRSDRGLATFKGS